MNKEQKLTERQELIDLLVVGVILDTNCGYVDAEEAYILADRLIRHGYRKQSDVAREFSEKLITNLEQYVMRHTEDGVPYYGADCEQIDDEIVSLAKEFGLEGDK